MTAAHSGTDLIKRSISIPAGIAQKIDAIAASRYVSANRAVEDLLTDGIASYERRRQEFLELAERFQESKDPIETEELREALGRLTFGASGFSGLVADLVPLADLPGTWSGRGFRLTARPDCAEGNDVFLDLHVTDESLVFDKIDVFGFHYLQKIDDSTTGNTLHVEPGIWSTVTRPNVARTARNQDGSWQLAEGSSLMVNGGPLLNPVNTVPFPIGGPTPPPGAPNGFPEYNLSVPNAFRTNPLPPGITQTMVTNPNTVLAAAIAGQTIEQTTVLNIGTVPTFTIATTPPTVVNISNGGGGVENIPFLNTNANAATMLATFWIEKVKHPSGIGHYLQLQYVQTVLFNFLGLSWPRVTVATLVKH